MAEWVKVGTVSDVKEGQIVQAIVDDEPVALANVGGEFLAVSDICSHEYVLLHDGFLEGDEIECPQHGSMFSLRTGEVRNPPATQPVPVYEVRIENDEVFLRLKESGLR